MRAVNFPVFSSYLKRPVIRASLWTFGGYGAGQVIRLISNLILDAAPVPGGVRPDGAGDDVSRSGSRCSATSGTNAAIIQNERGEDPAFLNTAWTIHIIRGFGLWAVACVIAWPVSKIYRQPLLFPMLCVAGSSAAISGFQSMAIATANRRLWLGRLTMVGVANQVATTAITIMLAWIFNSVWALVAGSVIGSAGRHRFWGMLRCPGIVTPFTSSARPLARSIGSAAGSS